MITIILFRLPDGKYLCGDAAKLAKFPQAGHCYLFAGKLYQVDQVVEPIGAGAGFSSMTDLLKLEHANGDEAETALAGMINLDQGGPLEGKIKLSIEPERFVLVRLKSAAAGKGASKTNRTIAPAGFTLDLQKFFDGPPLKQPRSTSSRSRRTGPGSSRRETF